MAAGDKQLRQIFEKTTISNINAIVVYNQLTEELVEKLGKEVKNLDGVIRQYDSKLETMQKQLAALQTRIFAGGT